MSATAAPENRPAGPAPWAPPEEKFWKRYSPHGEAPISLAGSFALHALAVGGLVLVAVYLASLFTRPTLSLPVELVQLARGDGPGGQSGKDKGSPPGPEAPLDDKANPPPAIEPQNRPALLPPAVREQLEEKYTPNDRRLIEKSAAPQAFADLESLLRQRRPGSSAGNGGVGPGPGKPGSARIALTPQQRRSLRWHMNFTANTGVEYLAQLRGLGATLAIPTKEGPDPAYMVVRELRPGARLLDEDISRFQRRIYWIDDKPRSVADVLGALGIRLPQMPSRFVAFMPESLENELYQMERLYVERVLKRRFDEDKIDQTVFRVVMTPRGYRPELIRVQLSGPAGKE